MENLIVSDWEVITVGELRPGDMQGFLDMEKTKVGDRSNLATRVARFFTYVKNFPDGTTNVQFTNQNHNLNRVITSWWETKDFVWVSRPLIEEELTLEELWDSNILS